ncbi:CopG family antitoxin [Mycobacterium haemophilum]|uniref:CopG family antitoxin n=1 Tax=Mycobacterium haemophilum TaxID=29311 RepID=UPI00069B4200|nr:CopG family antitoxin [Mycobacterium haemophilum]
MNKDELNELRDYYDKTDVASEFTDAELDTRTTDEVMVSTSIRLPQSLVDKVREQAAVLGIPATTLMRQWVIEKATTPPTSGVVSVAELQQFIAEHNRPIAS